MKKTASDPYFDYYEHEIAVASDQVLYHFKVKKNKEICLYNRLVRWMRQIRNLISKSHRDFIRLTGLREQ